jgi:hypothetical protein
LVHDERERPSSFARALLLSNTAKDVRIYEVRPRKDRRGVDLISNALPFGRLWYGEPDAVANAIGYAKFRSRSHDAVIRVCRLLRLPKRIGLKSYLRLSAVL